MPIIEGLCIDSETSEPIIAAPIEIRTEDGKNLVAETHSDMKGEWSISVPVGKYQVLMLSQIYQPVLFKILDDEGNFTPITENGRRIRIESIQVTLAPAVE
jgi:hypothetical protein